MTGRLLIRNVGGPIHTEDLVNTSREVTMVGAYVFAAALVVAAVLVLTWAVRRRRDRTPGKVIAAAALAWALLIPASGLTGSAQLVLAMLLVLLIVFPLAALVVDVRQWVERREARRSAIAAGMDPREARRRYRRQPRPFWLVLVSYALVALGWVFALIGMFALLDQISPGASSDLVENPHWTFAGSAGQPPYDMPWWMGVVAGVAAVGVVHAMVNFIRREIASDATASSATADKFPEE